VRHQVLATNTHPEAWIGGHYAPALKMLRSTVKWMVGSLGIVAASIIAGAQLVNYNGRTVYGAALAAVAVATALALTLLLLARAAAILTVPRPTAMELANAETINEFADARRSPGQFNDSKVEWLQANTIYLLGGYNSVKGLLAAYSQAHSAVVAHPRDEESRYRLTELEQHLRTVEEAAHYRDTCNAYVTLMRQFRTGAVGFIIAVIVFSVSGLFTTPKPLQPTNPVTQPIAMRVIELSPQLGSPQECVIRDGVAIGGTLTTPIVAVAPAGRCPAETVVGGQPGLMVIPHQPTRG
jgi:hypothetical protein